MGTNILALFCGHTVVVDFLTYLKVGVVRWLALINEIWADIIIISGFNI